MHNASLANGHAQTNYTFVITLNLRWFICSKGTARRPMSKFLMLRLRHNYTIFILF